MEINENIASPSRNDHLPRFPSITRKNLLEALKDVNVANVSASDTIKDKSELYILEPGLAFPSSLNKFKLSLELTFNVDNNPDHAFVVHIPDNELKRPVSGLAKDGSFTEDPDYTELSIYSQPDVVDAASFGRSFLSQVRFTYTILPIPANQPTNSRCICLLIKTKGCFILHCRTWTPVFPSRLLGRVMRLPSLPSLT